MSLRLVSDGMLKDQKQDRIDQVLDRIEFKFEKGWSKIDYFGA